VLSAFYVAAYASLSIPAVLAGIVVSYVSLTATFEIFGTIVGAIALVVALQAWRTRPRRERPDTLQVVLVR
jgi:heme/copper-type cytochrome/quinol oxidase subunit 1